MEIERYFADYGNLRLKVDQKGDIFEFRVCDKNDGATLWLGNAPNVQTAQSSALFEAQIFVDDPHPYAPNWYTERR
jgi:hypothetical protein